jgi:hypothetical protein
MRKDLGQLRRAKPVPVPSLRIQSDCHPDQNDANPPTPLFPFPSVSPEYQMTLSRAAGEGTASAPGVRVPFGKELGVRWPRVSRRVPASSFSVSSRSESLLFVSSRPESAEWRDPGFRPRATGNSLSQKPSRAILPSVDHLRGGRQGLTPAPSGPYRKYAQRIFSKNNLSDSREPQIKGAIVPPSHKGRGKEVSFPSDATAPSVILTEASERSLRATTSDSFAQRSRYRFQVSFLSS